MELKILELLSEYGQSEQSPLSIVNHSNLQRKQQLQMIRMMTFRILHIQQGKEKVDTCSSSPKKKPRKTITHIQNKSSPRVISKQSGLRKSPRSVNIAKIPKMPLSKKQAKKPANVPACRGIKQNVQIKESIAF
ncbi:hypothetical protein EJD97_015192 [Solanum chilense]|uniref:Uncharacterized protein n=1 Tax=Solanum chilense TaxID=4083 RepID=A0A6N2B7D3_SOLCI|nr:hypothetical protein EJD97_015192 [Solanum chilense]